MKIVSLVARILFGLMFVVFGLNEFLWFMPASALTGPVQMFLQAAMVSHFVWFYSGVQIIVGALLLLNRYMPFAIVVAAAVIANILAFLITMFPAGLPLAMLVLVLWFLTAWPLRAHFAPLFAKKIE
jgi:hypothetical protein